MKRNRSQDVDEINNFKVIIGGFRVVDLQAILRLFNISRLGKKCELQKKVLDLIRDDNLNEHQRKLLHSKIKELSLNKNPIPIANIQMSSNETHKTGNNNIKPAMPISFTNTLPLQPDVKFKRNPFFDNIAVLLPPSTLTPSKYSSEQVQCYSFNLTPSQSVEINKNCFANQTSLEYAVQVQIRFCLLVTTSKQNDLLPTNLQLKVNNRVCTLPPFLPCRPNSVPKRLSKPIEITTYVKVSPEFSNIIEVRWQKEHNKNFVIGCFLVRKLTTDILFQRIDSKSDIFTQQMIKEKLNQKDSEITTTMLRVSLLCPLVKTRMKVPCRASTCKHLQCFDGIQYLRMNEKKPTWICPVCNKEAFFKNLFIDKYFLDAINRLNHEISEIQLHEDGSYSEVKEKTKDIPETEGVLISDDEDDDDNNNNVKKMKFNDIQSIQRSKKGKEFTIDLTIDD